MQLPSSLISSWKYQTLKVNLLPFFHFLPSFLSHFTNPTQCFWESLPMVSPCYVLASSASENSFGKPYCKLKNKTKQNKKTQSFEMS